MDNEILKAIQKLRTEMNQRFDLVGNLFDRMEENRKADRIEFLDLFVKRNAKMDSGFRENEGTRMNGDPGLTEQEKLDRVAERIFDTPKTNEDIPTPTKEDLERPFRISFRNSQPVFEEVKG